MASKEDVQLFKFNQEMTSKQIDTVKISVFFEKYAKLKPFENQVLQLYRKNNIYIWFDQSGINEFAQAFYTYLDRINEEGLRVTIPYRSELDNIFQDNIKSSPEAELLISSLYFFYIDKVYNGLPLENSQQTGWNLPREKICYTTYLDTIVNDLNLKKEINYNYFNQYYALKKVLKKYIDIEKNGGWIKIELNKKNLPLHEGDSSLTVQQLRKRLFTEGFIEQDSGNSLFDKDILSGILRYENTQHRDFGSRITSDLIESLNISVADRIKTISVNMERCRWISPKINYAQEYIAVNIPSFKLLYFRDAKPYLISKVIVGKEFNKTAVFSGKMSYIAFSPYWNVPNSIYQKEILPKLKKNPQYLQEQNMEWFKGSLRQKPGVDNALGLVKFIFPNSNNIYLHDTPSKSFFKKEKRAFSHGCIRVEKAHELALAIMDKDALWSAQKVDAAMHAEKESVYILKNTIPVYIAYFTAWADQDGNIAFYEDLYNRDNDLAKMLFDY
jgi:murein L,D-transpeptidase YcbB/YkuD